MLYSNEVQSLLAAFPERAWRMKAIVHDIAGARPDHRRRHAVRVAVRDVLVELERIGLVTVQRPDKTGGFSLYRWKVIDEVAQKR